MKHLRKRTKKNLLCLALAALLAVTALPLPAQAATSAEIQKELDALDAKNDEIQAQINAVRSKYNANYDQMSDIVARKEAIDHEIALLNTKLENINAQISAYSQFIADIQDELDVSEETLQQLSDQYRERVRAMEEQGGLTYWQVIFQANSFTDLLDRLAIVEEISAADQRHLQEMRIAADLVEANRLNLSAEKRQLESTREELAATQAELEEKRGESDGLLIELEAKQEEYQAMLDESEALQDELMDQIAKKEAELSKAKYNENLKKLALQGQNPPSNASWMTPVSGYTITSAFGMRLHPVLGYNRMHNGIDMACSQGTPIYATRAGTVTTASYQAGGAGYYVSINHGDGFSSIYMHMTNYVVSSGQSVSQGQLIGYVGSTGISTGPHLHFGISYAGTYVNPLAYIL